MSNVAKKYIWSFFNPAAGRVAIVTDEKDVAKAVDIYKELGYKNIDKIEFISEAYAEDKGEQLQQAQEKIERLQSIIIGSALERVTESLFNGGEQKSEERIVKEKEEQK